MSEEEEGGDNWEGGYEDAERQQLLRSMSMTAEQRLQWVEDMIRFSRTYARKRVGDQDR